MKVLFTGISGVGLESYVQRFAAFVRIDRSLPEAPIVLKAEKYLIPILYDSSCFQSDFMQLEPSQQMIYSLGLPKPLLRKAWSESVRKLELCESDGKDIFLCAHAVFYHQLTREFFSPLDMALLKAWCPEIVITIIDDTENCLERLMSYGQMFSSASYSYSELKGFDNAVSHLRLLFDWRAIEIVIAERIAADIGCPHYILAAKHPKATVTSLVYDRHHPVTYISHPISQPRRDLLAGRKDSFAEFYHELRRVCDRLNKHVTLIEPTTIDEFRLEKAVQRRNGSEKDVYLPMLTERWPVATDSLWKSPDCPFPNPLDPGNAFSSDMIAAYKDTLSKGLSISTANDILCEIASVTLSVIVGNIMEQIDARDHKLVEQSNLILVLRPVFEGNASRGVEEEIRFHCQLCLSGVKRGPIWIYTTQQDEFDYICKRWIVDRIDEWMKKGWISGSKDRDADLAAVEEVCRSLPFSEDRAVLANTLFKNLATKGLQISGEPTDRPLDGRKENASVSAQANFIKDLKNAKPPYLSILEDYRNRTKCVVWYTRIGPKTSIDEFLNEMLALVEIKQ